MKLIERLRAELAEAEQARDSYAAEADKFCADAEKLREERNHYLTEREQWRDDCVTLRAERDEAVKALWALHDYAHTIETEAEIVDGDRIYRNGWRMAAAKILLRAAAVLAEN
jgi:uncharacterized coiled-coil DUF342 family protein